jgi:hypothetical protein
MNEEDSAAFVRTPGGGEMNHPGGRTIEVTDGVLYIRKATEDGQLEGDVIAIYAAEQWMYAWVKFAG